MMQVLAPEIEAVRGQWLTVAEFCRLIKRPQYTVYLWARNGTLEAFKVKVRRSPKNRLWLNIDEYAYSRLQSPL